MGQNTSFQYNKPFPCERQLYLVGEFPTQSASNADNA